MDFALKNNITWHNGLITKSDREKLHGHRGCVVWFTGLSASGKSTIAHQFEKELYKKRCSTYVFDGDNVRHGLCKDLGFSEEDRSENIRRIAEMANLFIDTGIIALTAFISPFRRDRSMIKELVGDESFIEIYVDCPVDICAKRDPKGIYEKAISGKIKNFTGISSPYEPPEKPDLIIRSHEEKLESSVNRLYELLCKRNIINCKK